MSYATLADARAEGVTTEQASDGRLQQLLDDASRSIDAATGWWFEPRRDALRHHDRPPPSTRMDAERSLDDGGVRAVS